MADLIEQLSWLVKDQDTVVNFIAVALLLLFMYVFYQMWKLVMGRMRRWERRRRD